MGVRSSKKKILLTIDVEDWFQVENLRKWIPPSKWKNYQLRVEKNTYQLLDLFDQFSPKRIRATFFVLGWIASRLPDLVREINNRGHEVASHGYGHMMCNQLSMKKLTADLAKSKQILEEIISEDVKGYRAPNFSINDQALEAVKSVGYKYDSSFNDFSAHGRYGQISMNSCERYGIALKLSNDLLEIPISNLKISRHTIPWGGGGYFRFMPFALFNLGVQKILKKHEAYMFYAHPWEIDPDQPRISNSKGLNSWRHYLNLDKTYSRLKHLISKSESCEFLTCSEYLEQKVQSSAPAL